MSRPLSDITNGRQSRALKRRDHDFVAILLVTIDQKSEASRVRAGSLRSAVAARSVYKDAVLSNLAGKSSSPPHRKPSQR